MKLELSNSHGNDFVNCLTTLRASEGDVVVSWSLPDRLAYNEQVLAIALREIQEELKDRIRAKEQTRIYR